MRKGTFSSTAETVALLRWRDEDGSWRNPLTIAFGEKQRVVEFRSLGVSRRRQWELEFTDSQEIVLESAVVEFDELTN